MTVPDFYMNISIVVFGLNEVGSNFSRDLMRFVANYKSDNVMLNINFIDSTNVEKEDINTQFFLAKDIGYNKASTMKFIWSSIFEKKRNVSVTAYNTISTAAYKKSGYVEQVVLFVVCTTNIDERRAIYNAFLKEKNAIFMIYTDKGIATCLRSNRDNLSVNDSCIESVPGPNISLTKALTYSHLAFTYVVNLLSEGKMGNSNMICDFDNYATGKEEHFPPIIKGKKCKYSLHGKTALICIGVGGTGGNFCRDAVKLLLKDENLVLVLVDGDRVEEKNCSRQPFGKLDLMQYKAEVIKEQLGRDYPELCNRIFALPCYLEQVGQLESYLNQLNIDNEIILGCVDNHRARQVLHEYFDKKDTILYLDSANEFSVGEVVVSIKKDQEVIAPARAYYYPDVLTDRSPSAAELSCGAINQSAPQHQVTNVVAAHIMLSILEKLLQTGEVMGGIDYFNSFEYFSRFQPWDIIKE